MLLKLLFMGALALGQAVAAECLDFDEVRCSTEDGSLVVNIAQTINPDGAAVLTFTSDDAISTNRRNVRVSGDFVVGEYGVMCIVSADRRSFFVKIPTGFSPRRGLAWINVVQTPLGEDESIRMSVHYWTGAENPQHFPYPGGLETLSCSQI